jgi:hypothetical protein
MNLSYKDKQFLIEAIDFRLRAYEERLKILENLDEDEASNIGNDVKFLKSLRHGLCSDLRYLLRDRDNKPTQ